jgi:type I restriction enzyme S subunit
MVTPPLDEQIAIAAFLDWKTGQIDALIARKKELLEKLKEKRLAVITQAVTRGLGPAVPLRDSGIPWLGLVPAHWEILRLKWAVMLQRGHDLPADERVDGNVPIVSSSGISGFHDTAVAKAPGIVTGRYGTIGVFHLIEEDYWPLNTTLYSNDLNGNEPRFLRALLGH